jgi:transposase
VSENFFAIPGTRNVSYRETEDCVYVDAAVIADDHAPACACGVTMRRSGFETRSVVDAPVHGRRVLVEISRQRFRCSQDVCASFSWPLDGVEELARVSDRARAYIRRRAVLAPFSEVAAEVGVGPSTVRDEFDEHVVAPMAAKAQQTAAIIGLDEVKLGRFRSMLTDVENSLPLDLLEERSKEAIVARLRPLAGVAKVVVMDMCEMHRAAAREAIPGVVVVADKFHVLRYVGQKLDKCRAARRRERARSRKPKSEAEKALAARLRGTLDGRFLLLTRRQRLTDAQKTTFAAWLKAYPDMREVVRAKLRFERFYECETRAEAAKFLDNWMADLEPVAAVVFAGVVKQFKAWRSEILAYWDHPYTAAFTEAMNGRLKRIAQSGRGYSWDVLRAKFLLSADAPKLTTLRPHAKKKADGPTSGGGISAAAA